MASFLRLRPLILTFLLILFYGSGSLFVTSLSVMFIAAIVTFICFTFKIQIDFDYIFVLFEKTRLWTFKQRNFPQSAKIGNWQRTDRAQRFSQSFNSLKDIPRPIGRKIKMIIDGVMRDFVLSWYEQVGSNEKQFLEETRKALETVSVEGYKKICNMDGYSTAVGLINLLTKHIKIFNDCCNAVNSKYPGISQQDFEQCILELYETRVTPHITSKNQGTELDFLRKITDMILFKLLPNNSFSCEGGRFMLREILAINGLYKLINLVSDEHFINQALIDIFEEPVSIEKLLKEWKNEDEKDLYLDDDLLIEEQIEIKQDSDGYESATDDKNNSKNLLNVKKNQSDSSIENLVDNLESRYVTPNHSTTELSSAEESFNAFDRVLRQNQLEARIPAPVYGSTMVKLYNENKKDNATAKTSFSVNEQNDFIPVGTAVFQTRKEDFAKGNQKIESFQDTTVTGDQSHNSKYVIQKKNDTSSNSITKIRKSRQKFKEFDKINDNDVPKLSESWGYCPPSTSGFYRKKSYDKMNKRQDLFSEQFKARFHSIGCNENANVSCFNLNSQKNEIVEARKSMKLYSEESVSCYRTKDSEDVIHTDNTQDDDERLKIHSVPDRNIFYETAPNCPTCIEMTLLANPFGNGEPMMMDISANSKEHDCGLADPHLFYSEMFTQEQSINDDDNESFISCHSDSPTELEISINDGASESTLLASSESLESDGSYFNVIKNLPEKITTNTHGLDAFDIVSLAESDTEFSSVNDFEQSAYSSDNEESDKQIDKNHSIYHRAPSVTTFASAVDSSVHENESQKFTTPFEKSIIHRKPKKLQSIFQKIKFPSKIKRSNLKLIRTHKDSNSTDDEFTNIPSSNKTKDLMKRKERRTTNEKDDDDNSPFHSLSLRFQDETCSLSSFSGATDTDTETYSKPHLIDHSNKTEMEQDKIDEITELADELEEDFDESDIFEDAKSIFEIENISNAAVITESMKFSDDELNNERNNRKADGIIPIYEGEVILPNPGKIPVSAWMYPMQMISIPTTEVAFERGWEPGGNKYTLYNIHYDIRIWPEIYKRELLEASINASSCTDIHETLPLIREIKRRYREFMFLHNRLTHSQMSIYMKGVLRPNRRYAMPFGRMDPDVIAGRRKILESYLVSLVSRQDVCNSREFKEFLGAEGYGNPSFIKPKLIKPKQMENKFVGSIKNALTGSKEITEKGESSRYFIHGYDVPRMFGYADVDAFNRHSLQWFSNFVNMQIDRKIHPEGQSSTNQSKTDHYMGQIEFFQKPKLMSSIKSNKPKNEATSSSNDDDLGPRLSGDGSESTDNNPQISLPIDSPDRRFSVGIAALFSNELAARTRNETLSILDARKAAEEIPWPLTDAVMSFMCQALKGMNCWLTYENVQQAVLYSLGGILEWKISQLISEIFMKERWMKYLGDLHDVIWENGKLKEPPLTPNEQEKLLIKEKAIEKFLDFLPAIIRVIIGTGVQEKWTRELLHSVQYAKINRHVLYAAIEIIIAEFIPELQDGFTQYKIMTQTSNC